MKKKIFNLSIVLIVLFSLLICLTACNNEEDDDEKETKNTKIDTSSAEEVIEAIVNGVNEKDANSIIDLIDIDALEKTYEEDIDKKEFKKGLKDFFDKNEDLEIKASKIKSLEEDDELLESLLSVYESYDEYIEKIEEDYGVKNVVIYTAKLSIPEEYQSIFDEVAIEEGKDVIYMTENDGEYKLIYSLLSVGLYSDYLGEFDVDEDEISDVDDNENQDVDEDKEAKEFNAVFEKYEGKQSGSKVKKLLDDVNKYKTIDNMVYVNYYGEDGFIEEVNLYEDNDVIALKEKIKSSHDYQVEFDINYRGYIRSVDITY